ncbi:MAG: efflux RND transporter permease subunit [Phycisphaerae bacterium]|nr:efflux RND transporter permease subunit [Phycisphaerae bacterium]
MDIIRFAIENPVKVAVGVILVMLFGFLSIFQIPVQLTPDVDKPVITVTTRWEGASPQEIESEIIDRQEDKLKSVTNLKKMTSSSQENEGKIVLEFPVGVDKDIAYRDVSDKLRQVSNYPEEVDEPVMSATDDDMANTIAWMVLYSKDHSDIAHLKTYIEDNVKPLLERAEGISEVPVYGGLTREVQVIVDPYKLAARSLTFRDVERALRRQNTNISAGTIAQGKRDYTYRTLGEFRSLDEIQDTVVAYREGGPILVGDVANVVDGYKKALSFVRSKGRPVLALPARKETGANVITAMENLKKQVEVVNREILTPRGLGLELTQVYDETEYIWSSIRLVVTNIFTGGLLAIGVLWLFLRSGSATGIIAVAIPISVVGTFLAITLVGRSLNVVMLAGMAFAVGMVVDNAIVVLENIYRHRTMGKSKVQAAFDGAKEVWGAVLASTLTTMAVFLPVITIEEEAGQLFKDIAIAISSAVGLSLLVSVLVIPPLASRFFSASRAMAIGSERPWWFAERVAGLVRRLHGGIGRRVAIVLGLSAAAILGSWWMMPGAEYLPAGNRNLVFGMLISPPGYSIEEFRRMATVVEEGDPDNPYDGARPAWEADVDSELAKRLPEVQMKIGAKGDQVVTVDPPPIENFFFVSFSGGAFMGATSKIETVVKPLEQVLANAAGRIPGVFSFFQQSSLFRSGRSGGNNIDVEIRADDQESVVKAAQALQQEIMAQDYGFPQPDPGNYNLGRPEIQIVPDRAKAADLGLDVSDVGFIVEASVDGAFVGEYNDRGDKIDLAIKVGGTENATVEQIGQIPIYTPSGHVVPIASAVNLVRTTAPQQINHIEEMNSVTLSVRPKAAVPLQTMMENLQNDVIAPLRASGKIPSDVITVLAGTADKLTQTMRSFVGDFRGTVTRPHIFGLSVGLSMAALALAGAVVVLVGGLLFGARVGANLLALVVTVLAVGFGALNPEFVFMAIQSRMVLALLITYLLMAALFESFAYPFVILFSVPLAAVGGFAALQIVHQISLYDVTLPVQQMDVVTMLGFVILIGIVVNNAILIVHQSLNFMREEQLTAHEAVVRSVQTRTRPIFMTAMTSVFGMAPLVVLPGAGSELYRGLGSVVLGGLLVSTVFTLVVVPSMFSLFMDAKGWVAAAVRQRRAERAPEGAVAAVGHGSEA